jgi:hypothetical protein
LTPPFPSARMVLPTERAGENEMANRVTAKVVGNTVRIYMTNKAGEKLSTGLTAAQARNLISEINLAIFVVED